MEGYESMRQPRLLIAIGIIVLIVSNFATFYSTGKYAIKERNEFWQGYTKMTNEGCNAKRDLAAEVAFKRGQRYCESLIKEKGSTD